MRDRFRSTIALAAGVLLFGACGSEPKVAATVTTTATAAAPATTAAAASTSTAQAAATTAAADPKAGWPKKLVFSVVPAEQNTDLSGTYKPLVDVLKAKTGLDVEFFQATDYNGVIEAMISGKVDIAEFGPFSYLLAKNNGAKIDAIATMVSAKDAKPGYQAYGIVKADSPIKTLAEYKGKKVCFVDPGSTSGYLYPAAGLLGQGIDPTKDVTGTFAGGHDTSALAVKDGTCDAGFAFDTMVDKTLVEKGSIKASDLRVVWKSDVIPGAPVALNTKLPKSLFDLIKTTFLEDMNKAAFVKAGKCTADDKTCKVTSDASIWGFVDTTDSYYDPIRAVCTATKAAKCLKG